MPFVRNWKNSSIQHLNVQNFLSHLQSLPACSVKRGAQRTLSLISLLCSWGLTDLKMECPSCIPPLSLSLVQVLIWSHSKISFLFQVKRMQQQQQKNPHEKIISFQVVHLNCHFRFSVNAYFFQHWKINL